jgi:hypothetical protein
MMKLRTKFILFVVILHLIVLVLSYFILNQHKLLFIISEVFILISILLAWQLYKKLIQPLQLLIQGTEALREKDFNIRFTPTGQYEMDQLIGVYNQMTDELRGERLKQQQQHVFLGKLIETSLPAFSSWILMKIFMTLIQSAEAAEYNRGSRHWQAPGCFGPSPDAADKKPGIRHRQKYYHQWHQYL